jgi:hypothetical protein
VRKKPKKKLVLSYETLRILAQDNLRVAIGGGSADGVDCHSAASVCHQNGGAECIPDTT